MEEYANNPFNLIPGDIVILDKGFNNSSRVKIVKMSPKDLFSRIVPAELTNPIQEDSWEVMTNRLTPIT